MQHFLYHHTFRRHPFSTHAWLGGGGGGRRGCLIGACISVQRGGGKPVLSYVHKYEFLLRLKISYFEQI